MRKINWQRMAARRASLQKSAQFAAGAYKIGQYFDLPGIDNQIWLYDGRTTYIYFGQEDTSKYLLSLKKKVQQINFVENFAGKQISVYEKSLKQMEGIVNQLDGKSVKELFLLHRESEDMWTNFYSHGWMPFFLAPLEEVVTEYVTKKTGSQDEAMEIMAMLAQPGRATPTMKAERAMLELVSIMQRGETKQLVNKKAKDMAGKFGWMPVYDYDDKPRKSSYYIAEAGRMIDAGIDADAKLKELDALQIENERRYKEFLDEVDDKLVREQIKLLNIAGYVRDFREEARDRMTIMAKGVYVAMGDALGYSLKEMIQLTTAEIEEAINDEKKRRGFRDRVCTRQQGYVFMQKSESYDVLDNGNDIKKIQALVFNQMDKRELSGQVAYVGKTPVCGVVKVVMSGKEADKVNEGDILVASMTKPDFVGAMKKAVAFVTDEGGITCHAAIVARELKKPCIIGTKMATQILKDGDMVEVDTDKGVVRKI
jgi:phosphohistidine swiveling domain-containing protein